MITKYTKDPDAVLDYQFNWESWLADGDEIESATVTPESGLTVDSTAVTAGTVTAWVSGGTAGNTYDLTCHIVTTDGREDDRTIRIVVKER